MFQLQRNILATCPRVTRFKIDWGDGGETNDGENQPPSTNTGNESNQMGMDGDKHGISKEGTTEFNGTVLCGSTTDSNGMDLAAASKVFAAQSSAAVVEEPMQM